MNAHAVASLQHQRFLERDLRCAVDPFDQHMPGLPAAAAVDAPGGTKRALEAGRNPARLQHPITALKPEPAAELAGPAGVSAQAEALDHERVACLVVLDRDHPRVAVAHGAERPRSIHVAQRAPAAEAAVVALPVRPGGRMAAGVGQRRKGAVVGGRGAIGNAGAERADDEVDQHRQRRIVGAHRRGRFGADDRALGQDQLERAERALVGIALRQQQVSKCEPRHGFAAAAAAGIHGSVHLGGQLRQIDRHIIVLDDDGDFAGQRVSVQPVVVEHALRRIGAVGNGADRRARFGLGLIPDRVERVPKCRDAIACDQFHHAVAAEQTPADLRVDVAHHLDRKARVVLDHPVHLEHRFAARAQLHGAELDALLEDIGGELRYRTDVPAADVDPVHDHHHEADQRRLLRRIDRRVHGDVV